MDKPNTVAQSVRDEVLRHSRGVLPIERTTRQIAARHHCPSDVLIRQAIIRQIQTGKQVAQL
ncbi:hypothetical protein [Pelagibacterium montanilacus]|uniref:hypothetical protein n=1 Tax=Pelagibacterium montanilacus TaxID=2185280 RepID=UPI000F8EC24F|nr:hypothetical protein [Pelagibacterium montanilacus]